MKTLLHIPSGTIKPYPRDDDLPVVGLSAEYDIYNIIQNTRPDYNSTTHYLSSIEIISRETKEIIRSWEIVLRELPTESSLFNVMPENIQLATTKSDETEFNKLVTLTQLGMVQNKLLPSTIIKIQDNKGISHEMTIERFLDIIVDYGLFCYTVRNNI